MNATIRAQVQGYLIKQNYREGDLVKKGQVLFEIDPRTFQAALEQAKGQLEAQQARWTTAKANLARIKPLAEQNAVSKKDLDDSIGTEQAARAAVLSAQAAVDKAQLDLGFTKITSPVDGIAGLAKAQIGNLVGPGATEELTTVSTVNPIKVYIQVSEQEYLQAGRDAGQRGREAERRNSSSPTGASTPKGQLSPSPTARSTSRRGPSRWRPSSPTRAISCGPVSTGRSALRPRSARMPCWCPSGPWRKYRESTWWPSWGPTTRWTSGP